MSCPSGKRSYPNSVQAISALMLLRYKRNGRRKHNFKRQERGAYKCPLCAQWHVTKQPGATIDLGIDDT